MTFVHDTRDKKGKHQNVDNYLISAGHKVVRSKMYVGDITLLNNQSVCVDLKKNLLEVCGNVGQQIERFSRELNNAKQNDIKLVILTEEPGIESISDVRNWINPRLKESPLAISGERLAKIMYSLEKKYGCEFAFCNPYMTGQRVCEILGVNNDGKGKE